MYTGKQTIDWLYSEQLKVDKEWAVKTPNGFRWWADKNAQTIEVIGKETGPDGELGYFVSVRTDLLRSVDLNRRSLEAINAFLMPFASMAGPVYDPNDRSLSLCSLVRVHGGIYQWMNLLVSVAAVLQIGEARIVASKLAEVLDAEEATSGHPRHGMRPEPDEMATLIETLIEPMGQESSRWPDEEFQKAVDQYMNRPPALLATAGGAGFTVEFPYGSQSSLCQVKADQPHPRYGNGLLVLQSFPVSGMSEIEGIKLALSMNEIELTHKPIGYGLGSYAYTDDTIVFTSFIPNVAYKPGLLPNIYFSCAQRAQEISIRLTNQDWSPEVFTPRRSALGRMIDRIKGRNQ